MAKTHIIDQDRNKGVDIKHGDGTWIVKDGATINYDFASALDNSAGHNDVRYVIQGDLGVADTQMYWGIHDVGNRTRIDVAESGKIGGGTAIKSSGNGLVVINDGLISGPGNALLLEGRNFLIKNSGVIAGDDVDSHSFYINNANPTGRIVNQVDGLINGQVVSESEVGITLVNKGMMSNVTATFDILLGAGEDRLVNSGTIKGTALLGEGNDIANLMKGTVEGFIRGGLGDDTYIVDNMDARIYEGAGEGTDMVKTTVSFSATQNDVGSIETFIALGKADVALVGNGLDNILRGNAGKNMLSGESGDDSMYGGKGEDIFVFGTGYGSDRITDFENGKDKIILSGWDGASNFEDVEKIASVDGKNVVLSYLGDELTLRNTRLSELDASDFIF